MAEVLSQSQIDALLKSMTSGDSAETVHEEKKEAEQNWKKYDFYSPKKFTKDRLKLLKGVFDNYCRLTSSRMNSILRTSCEMEVISVEEQRYHEFSNLLTDNDVMYLMPMKLPDESKAPPIVIHITPKIMINMMDRLLGGLGNEQNIDTSYTYTEIELCLYEKVMHYLFAMTADAWSNYVNVEVGKYQLETNPTLFQEISVEEPVAIILVNIDMNGLQGLLTLCIPGSLLTNIFQEIDRRRQSGGYDDAVENSPEIILNYLKKSPMEVKVNLGEAKLSLQDIYQLRVGDVIDLRKEQDSDVTLYVEGQPWFEGKLGSYKKNAAVRIERRVEKDPGVTGSEQDGRINRKSEEIADGKDIDRG
jgi:flagellar motor switch protein FliM